MTGGTGGSRTGLRTFADVACQTCGDATVVARVVRVRGDEADVADVSGRMVAAACELAENLTAGELVLVHVGAVLGRAGAADRALWEAAERAR